MAEPKPLIINAPRQGIAPSPHVGFGDMRNLDIFSIPGIAKLNNILEKKSSTTVDAQIKWAVKNPASPANIYAIDSNGVVYNSTDSGATWAELSDREGAGQGLAVFKDYLIVAESDKLDAYGPLSGTPAWTDDWQTLGQQDGAFQPMLVSKLDGNLYIGNGRYISSVAENSGQDFDPDTGATFTFTQKALTLPENYRVKCLAEQGNNLMIGTWMGTNIYDNRIADIFPWDGSSTTYGKPIQMPENGVNAMINDGGYLYILAGTDGKVYKSNGVQAWPIAQIPISVVNILGGKYLEPYPGAIMKFKGRIFFAVNSQSTDGMGIYSIMETAKGTILNYEHSISTLTTGGTNPVIIGALLPITRDKFIAGWRDNATYGIDLLSPTSFLHSTAYTKAYFESPLYQVGNNPNGRQFSNLEFYLAKELAASEGIQIKFRFNLTDTWTTIGTYTTTEIGTGVTSYNTDVNIPECEMLQIRVELLGTATTTPEFKSLILK